VHLHGTYFLHSTGYQRNPFFPVFFIVGWMEVLLGEKKKGKSQEGSKGLS
jgi:hypothetical protein